VLNGYCQEIGRDPAAVERTVILQGKNPLDKLQAYLDAGMTHLILGTSEPWNFAGVEKLLAWRDQQR